MTPEALAALAPAEAPDEPVFAVDEPLNEWVSVAALQCQLRDLFASRPPHRALARALQRMSELLRADYAVVHARYGNTPLSEEWQHADFNADDSLRESVAAAMADASSKDQALCVRLGGAMALVAAVLYDDGHEQAGSAAFVFRDCDRARAYEVLVQVESLVGFLALLLAAPARLAKGLPAAPAAPVAHVGEPQRLLLDLAAELGNRHGVDQVAIGAVRGHKVRVVLANGETELRAANPGVRLLCDAMGECLDRGTAVLAAGDPALAECRLHAAWLHSRGGGAVASLPMLVDGQPVAIVSVASADPAALTPEKLAAIGRELGGYAPLLQVARQASRSLLEHAGDALRAGWRHGQGGRRRLLWLGLGAAFVGWAVFGKLPYRLTVPCVVRAADQRTVSCPRDGILAEFFVRPGDNVRTGQLLAELDSHDDQLARVELDCERQALEAQIDRALADRDAGQLRVLEARRAGVFARLGVIERRIEQARIRAPQDGVVLTGDLRERLGSRLAMGESLYQLARSDGTVIELHIPERAVLDAHGTLTASFVAAADPGSSHELTGLRIAPASTVTDGSNTFLAEANAAASVWRLAPGMEGFAMLEVGKRPVWWVLGHRLLGWLRLNFWI